VMRASGGLPGLGVDQHAAGLGRSLGPAAPAICAPGRTARCAMAAGGHWCARTHRRSSPPGPVCRLAPPPLKEVAMSLLSILLIVLLLLLLLRLVLLVLERV
jgi:hypothetical protein